MAPWAASTRADSGAAARRGGPACAAWSRYGASLCPEKNAVHACRATRARAPGCQARSAASAGACSWDPRASRWQNTRSSVRGSCEHALHRPATGGDWYAWALAGRHDPPPHLERQDQPQTIGVIDAGGVLAHQAPDVAAVERLLVGPGGVLLQPRLARPRSHDARGTRNPRLGPRST